MNYLEGNSLGVSCMHIQFIGLINLCLGGLVVERKEAISDKEMTCGKLV